MDSAKPPGWKESTKKKFSLYSLIPERISSKTVLGFYEALRKIERFFSRDYSPSLVKNAAAFPMHHHRIRTAGGYVEDQHAYSDMSYGKTTISYSGCEVIAVYNAIYSLLGFHPETLPEIIHDFEKDGIVLSGRFGTSPKALADYLNRKGFQTEMTVDEAFFDDLGTRYPSLILTMYNNAQDIRDEIHTIHISKNADGFTAHNVYCDGAVIGPAESVTALLKSFHRGRAKALCLIGVAK